MIRLIAARARNGVIGQNGGIPWRLSNDMRFFRETTEGNTVVMGRKTFESIGKPLPRRRNIVLTRHPDYRVEDVTTISAPEELFGLPSLGDIYVIGGEQVYAAFMPHATEILLTVVEAEVSGDTYFPEPVGDWEQVILGKHDADTQNEYAHTIYKLTRR